MAKAKPKSTAVATQTSAEVSRVDWGEDAGKGFEGLDPSELKIPFLNLLQALSPEVADPIKKIPGAEAGMFFNTVTKELIAGDVGLHLVPCAREHKAIERFPKDHENRGKFVGRHGIKDPVVKRAQAEAADRARASGKQADKYQWRTPDGNDLIETFYLYFLIMGSIDSNEPLGYCLMSFSSSKAPHYQNIVTRMDSKSAEAPLYSNRLHIKGVPDRNSKGDNFFNVAPKFAIDDNEYRSTILPQLDGNTHPIFLSARALCNLVKAGTADVDFEDNAEPATGGDGSGEVEAFC